MWGFQFICRAPVIPDPSGQLAELIVYITSTRVDLYSLRILLYGNIAQILLLYKIWGYYRVLNTL